VKICQALQPARWLSGHGRLLAKHQVSRLVWRSMGVTEVTVTNSIGCFSLMATGAQGLCMVPTCGQHGVEKPVLYAVDDAAISLPLHCCCLK